MNEPVGDLSKMATGVGRWLCEQSTSGLPDNVDEDAILAAFEDVDIRELQEALAELELESCITLSHVIGPRLPRIQTAEELFLIFDPVVLKSRPFEYATQLIDLVLAGEDSVSLSELHDQSGLNFRNFNPAVGLIVGEIGEGRVSKTHSPDYPARYFSTNAEDRVALKQLRKRLAG